MKKKILTLIIMIFTLTGCIPGPGLSDYSYDVGNGDYVLVRSSAHMITISPHGGYTKEEEAIPAKVVEVAWNDRYVIAKQYGLVNRSSDPEDTYQIPDGNQVNYWLLDTKEKKIFGPYDLNTFFQKLQEEDYGLKVEDLKNVEAYNK